MARRLNAADKSFAADFQTLLFAKREEEEDVAAVVRGIIADVRSRGDAALIALTNKFDKAGVTQESLKLTAAEIETALGQVSKAQLAAIETALTAALDRLRERGDLGAQADEVQPFGATIVRLRRVRH